MKRIFNVFIVFFFCLLAGAQTEIWRTQMNIWHNGEMISVRDVTDIDSVTFGIPPEPEQVEVLLRGISIDTYYGGPISRVNGTEPYVISLLNPVGDVTYGIELASAPNNLAAPSAGTYSVVDNIETVGQAWVSRQTLPEEGNVLQVQPAYMGNVVISGEMSSLEITVDAVWPDGHREKLHYSGEATVSENKYEMYSEYEQLNVTSMVLDNQYSSYNFYEFIPSSSTYEAQGQLSAVIESPQYTDGIIQIKLSYLFAGENKEAQMMPTGEFPFYNMYQNGVAPTLDCIMASDYSVYQMNNAGYYLFYSEIYTITADGVTNIFYPQTGTLKIEAGSAEGSMKFTLDATSFNGSTFKGSFELPAYNSSYGVPRRLAPKMKSEWNTYLLTKGTFPIVKYREYLK